MNILLTNDDGIEGTGLYALYTALSEVGDVTAIAPATDQSAVGRAMSRRVEVDAHELGYAVDGTPADCVVVGMQALDTAFDLVVSGCNRGANLGAYVLGRSGTVSAAVEATFFDVPAMAVSMYIPGGDIDFRSFEPSVEEYEEPARAARYLAETTLESGVFEHADYLNVNAPMIDEGPCEMKITKPSQIYEIDAIEDEDHIVLRDRIFDQLADGSIDDPDGTDRRAIVDGHVSVSPLTAPHSMNNHETLTELATSYAHRATPD
ncbi:5'/3'-nucleotidase SurE [Halocatena salina]|uniref:5'-nucleotidase SurE n=1 Tax=Halocatena salina TaxID=2934340 RepID=A0A8U0A1F1_9EURY|nr:5'/3'-nucleotidase SurE [Halocatena salina]UPM42904.1 5'/3'-nucleotidase SurE [Halocatena salina]